MIEPFLGGGSAYFHLNPEKAILADINPDVFCAYTGIRDHYSEVEDYLREHQDRHSSDYYYKIRSRIPEGPAAKAARVIYLNRTCFNGIYRVNMKGVFNVPIGDKAAVTLPTDNFAVVSERLQRAELRNNDFDEVVKEAGSGDLVYADPPYTVRHNHNGFIKYNEVLFSWDDQVRLARALAAARDRGAKILATNAAHESVVGLYRRFGFCYTPVTRYSSIAADGRHRGLYGELLISSRSE